MTDADDPSSRGHEVLSEPLYLQVTYDEKRLPRTSYPRKLAAYLTGRFLRPKGRILDVGCGRGEFLTAFREAGLEVAGLDVSPAAPDLAIGHEVKVVDLEQEPLPYSAGSFDYVFCKSVLEHTRNPIRLLRSAYAALKPGGIAIVMVPAWETGYKGSFYIDHTHVTPFTLPALENAMVLAGFQVVKGELFCQLPFLWGRPWLKPVIWLIAALPLPYRPMHKAKWPSDFNKLIWFSKEAMLLVVGRRLTDETDRL
jgi:SAM-dependent methyltransferase